MSPSKKYHFEPIFLGHSVPWRFPTLELNEYQLSIIRYLAPKKAHSLYDLKKACYPPVKDIAAELSPYGSEVSERKRKDKPYFYAQIYNSVRELERKGLVKTSKDTGGGRAKRKVELTFAGIILFLRIFPLETKMERSKAKKVVNIYPHILPFSAEWDKISKILDEEKAFDLLKEAAKSFRFVQKVTFNLTRLNLEFEGYLRRPPIGRVPIQIPGTVSRKDRNRKFAEFLAANNKLLKAYISYLAVYDIAFLSYVHPGEVENWIDKLWCERELASFEERPVQTNSLFSGQRLREFFPRYAALNYFFTGLFMESLLWRTIEPARLLYPDKITLDY